MYRSSWTNYACASYVVDNVNKADRGISNLHKAIIKIMQENPEMQYVQHSGSPC